MKSVIESRANITYAEFAREYLLPNRPVILTDGLKDWPAVGKWNPAFFREHYRTKQVSIDGRDHALGELMDLVENSAAGHVAPYYRNVAVKNAFPELLNDISPMPPYVLPNWLRGPFYPSDGRDAEIYIGGAGGAFPFVHYDSNSTHAFLAQVYGDKEAVLYSPDDTEYMYPKTESKVRHHSRITDTENPDLAKFPLFAKAKAYRGVLKAGHLLFIPSRWWHTARMLSPSITISYNVVNHSNWNNVRDEICYKARCTNRLLVPPLYLYMTIMGWGWSFLDLF